MPFSYAQRMVLGIAPAACMVMLQERDMNTGCLADLAGRATLYAIHLPIRSFGV